MIKLDDLEGRSLLLLLLLSLLLLLLLLRRLVVLLLLAWLLLELEMLVLLRRLAELVRIVDDEFPMLALHAGVTCVSGELCFWVRPLL